MVIDGFDESAFGVDPAALYKFVGEAFTEDMLDLDITSIVGGTLVCSEVNFVEPKITFVERLKKYLKDNPEIATQVQGKC